MILFLFHNLRKNVQMTVTKNFPLLLLWKTQFGCVKFLKIHLQECKRCKYLIYKYIKSQMTNEVRAQELETKADKLIENGCWKKTEYQMQDISELYSKAANFYKMSKNCKDLN